MELEPGPKVTVLALRDGGYVPAAQARVGHPLTVTQPFPLTFDPAALTEIE